MAAKDFKSPWRRPDSIFDSLDGACPLVLPRNWLTRAMHVDPGFKYLIRGDTPSDISFFQDEVDDATFAGDRLTPEIIAEAWAAAEDDPEPDSGQAEALIELVKAAEQGDAEAQTTLAHRYANADGVKYDLKQAFKWFRKAAEQGHPRAQYNLAHCYALAKGVECDPCEAMKWCRKAAEQGHSSAQNTLGVAHWKGNGVNLDQHEAVKWYRQAAEQGNVDAQYNLGICYYEGQGVGQDHHAAVKWFGKAAEQNCLDAQEALRRIAERRAEQAGKTTP